MCDHEHKEHGGHDHHHHDHSHDAEDNSDQFSLFLKIHMDRLECLNEMEQDSGKTVFKPWDERLDTTKFVESDEDDPELLFNIPFTGNVKLKCIALLGGEEGTFPKTMKLYKNIENMSFDQTGKQPDQEFELPISCNEILQLPTKASKFSNVNHLSIYFPDNHGNEATKIYYIGLKGDFTQAQRQTVLITNYELSANPADHKSKLYQSSSNMIS